VTRVFGGRRPRGFIEMTNDVAVLSFGARQN